MIRTDDPDKPAVIGENGFTFTSLSRVFGPKVGLPALPGDPDYEDTFQV